VAGVQRTFSVSTHSGYVVAFDPAAVVLPGDEPPDLEALEAGAADRSIFSSPAFDDETMVRVLVDEVLPESLATVDVEAEMELRIPSGQLWIADPSYLHARQRPVLVPEAAGHLLDLTPGDYRATAYLLEARPGEIDAQLRRAAGMLPVALRDGLGIGTFFLGVLTVIGLPVFLIGRVLDDGLAGVVDGIGLGLAVLVLLWLVVLVAWRLPVLKRVDRADEDVARRHPDLVIALRAAATTTRAGPETRTSRS
jgi:hypothetical protein